MMDRRCGWMNVAACLFFLQAVAATEYFADAVNGNDAWDGRAEVYDFVHGMGTVLLFR